MSLTKRFYYIWNDAIFLHSDVQFGLKDWPFLSFGNYTLLCDCVKPIDMEGPLYIKDELIKLRQQEQVAQAQFTESKNRLLAIKKKIRNLENLLKPNLS